VSELRVREAIMRRVMGELVDVRPPAHHFPRRRIAIVSNFKLAQ
jgi:hypothetical protein